MKLLTSYNYTKDTPQCHMWKHYVTQKTRST